MMASGLGAKAVGVKQAKLPGVEALRGIAAVLVVMAHATKILTHGTDAPPMFGLWHFGRAGVDFFFVLSGFIITYVHYQQIGTRGRLGQFWFKRLWRIYPTWWIAAGLYAALLVVSPTPDRLERDVHHAVFSFFLLPEANAPVLGPGWSLRHELLFYGMFSTLLMSRKIGFMVLGTWFAGIVASMVWQFGTGEPPFGGMAGDLLFRGFNVQFFFGIGAAILLRRWRPYQPAAIAILGAAGFLVTGLFEAFGPAQMHEWPIRHLAYGLSAGATIYGVAALDLAGLLRWSPAAVRLGAASYSVYLLHVPVLLVAGFALRFAHGWMPVELTFVIITAIAVICGVVFSELVEQKLLRFGSPTAWRQRWMSLRTVDTAITAKT